MLFELAEVKTKDGILLQGLVLPTKSKKLALVYIHGLGGDFYGSPSKVHAFAAECSKRGYGFFTFNNRGSGLIGGVKKLDKSKKGYKYVPSGRAYERFEDCVYDIDAFVKEAKRRGYGKIALIGHSTGANKVVYYLSKNKDVWRAVLTGPISDVPTQKKQAGKKYGALIKVAKKLKKTMMPEGTPGSPITPKRFLSLSVAGSVEDVFQYHLKEPKYRSLKKIRIPTLAIIGGKDEYSTFSPHRIIESYEKANPMVEGLVFDGALHSFNGQEKLLAKLICDWLEK